LGETRSNRERRLRIRRPVEFGARAAVIAHRRRPPQRRFAGVGQSRSSRLDSGRGLAGEEARDTPNLPRGSLGHGTAANSCNGGKPVCAQRCSVMTMFFPRDRPTSYDFYLKSKRGLGRCSPRHEFGRAAVRGAGVEVKRRRARGDREQAAVGVLLACCSSKSSHAGPAKVCRGSAQPMAYRRRAIARGRLAAYLRWRLGFV
jgi:hypothetical protein